MPNDDHTTDAELDELIAEWSSINGGMMEKIVETVKQLRSERDDAYSLGRDRGHDKLEDEIAKVIGEESDDIDVELVQVVRNIKRQRDEAKTQQRTGSCNSDSEGRTICPAVAKLEEDKSILDWLDANATYAIHSEIPASKGEGIIRWRRGHDEPIDVRKILRKAMVEFDEPVNDREELPMGCTCDLNDRNWDSITGVCGTCSHRFRDMKQGLRSVTAPRNNDPR